MNINDLPPSIAYYAAQTHPTSAQTAVVAPDKRAVDRLKRVLSCYARRAGQRRNDTLIRVSRNPYDVMKRENR